MAHFSRIINISSKNLGRSATLVIVFDDQPTMKLGMYDDYFPVVWKTFKFPKKGILIGSFTYNDQLAFTNPQVKDDKIKFVNSFILIDPGKKTDLMKGPNSKTYFTTPTYMKGEGIKAINKTGIIQNIGVGSNSSGTIPPSHLLLFEDVGFMYNATAEFTPIISAYISPDYEENDVLREEISTPVIWKQDLGLLAETTNWTLKYDSTTGDYSITPNT